MPQKASRAEFSEQSQALEDLVRLAAMPRLHGTIIGKALYDGRITGNLRQIIG